MRLSGSDGSAAMSKPREQFNIATAREADQNKLEEPIQIITLRPISLLRLFLLRFVESAFPENSPWA